MSDDKRPLLVDIEAEQALLGVLLINNRAFTKIADYIRPEHFSVEVHGRIYGAIANAITQGKFCDARTLKPVFDKDPALQEDGGGVYLGRLCAGISATEGAEAYAQLVYDLAQRRELVTFAEKLRTYASDTSTGVTADEIVARASRKLTSLIKAINTDIGKRELAERIAESLKKPIEVFPTGLPTIDAAIGGGLIAGKHYGIAARKKSGKSRLCASISYNLNKAEVPHGFLTMEMTHEEIEQCNIGRDKGFNAFRFISNRGAEWLAQLVGEYATTVPDFTRYEWRPGASFDDVRRILSRWKMRGLKGAFVDCLQLIGGAGRGVTEEKHLRDIADWLTAFSRREDFFIVTTAQLNQEGNTRGGEGLKLACDMYLSLHREKDEPGAWLQMEETRFTRYSNIGSESQSGIWLHSKGPHFSSEPPSAAELDRAAARRNKKEEKGPPEPPPPEAPPDLV